MTNAGEETLEAALRAERGKRLLSYGRVAGWLFVLGAIVALPSTLLMKPLPSATDYVMTPVAFVTGAVFLVTPWDRLGIAAFHVASVIAVIEVALVVYFFDALYGYLFFVIAIYAAYVFPSLRQAVPQLVLIWLALCLPAVYDPQPDRSHLRLALFGLPVIALAAGMISFRRLRLAAAERDYERLVAEAAEAGRQIQRSLRASDA